MIPDATTAATRIAEINTILAGPRTVTIGDRSIAYDFAELRKERAYLRKIVASSSSSSFRKVVFKSG